MTYCCTEGFFVKNNAALIISIQDAKVLLRVTKIQHTKVQIHNRIMLVSHNVLSYIVTQS